MLSRLIFAVAVILLASKPLGAEDKGHSFMLTLWDEPHQDQTFLYSVPNSRKTNKLDVKQMHRSKVHYIKSDRINIHSKGAKGVNKVATVKFDPTYKCSLIILKKKENGTYETIIINDGPESAPYGSYLFYNHSEIEITGMLGDEVIKLAPHSSIIARPKAKNGAALNFQLWYTPDKNSDKKKFLERNTWITNSNKYLMMILSSEKSPHGKIKLESKVIVTFKK